MRILQINKFIDPADPRGGGPLTYITHVSERLRAAGHEVYLFGCASTSAPELPTFVDYTRLRGLPAKLVGALRIIHDPVAAAKLDAFLSRHPVDVAHIHNIYHHLTPSILPVLTRRGVPVVMSMRDYRLFCPVKAFYRRGQACTKCLPHGYYHCVLDDCANDRPGSVAVAIETFVQRFFRRYINHVHRFLCPSRYMVEVLRADNVPAGKIELLRNPIPMPPQGPGNTEQPPPEGGPAEQPPAEAGGLAGETILFVGRLSEEKGPELMLDLAAAFPDRRVVLVGGGDMRALLAEAVAARRLANVELVGHVTHDRLGEHYRRSAVVVLPSRCFENSPHSLLEGMAWGRCVVAPAHGPIREWVEDGRTGRLFAPGDAGDLVRVVGEALADPSARARLGAEAARRIHLWHDPGGILDKLEHVYSGAIRRRP